MNEEILMATTDQHIAARNDPDLLARLVAAAEMSGITSAESTVRSNLGQLMTIVVTPEGAEPPQTIADVHAFAVGEYAKAVADMPGRPGQDAIWITDDQLMTAVATLAPQSTPTE